MPNDSELKQLAVDIAEGSVYTSIHYKMENETLEGIEHVFMPLLFGAGKKLNIPLKKLGFVYEYLSEATPVSINGAPVFMSMQYLSMDDTKILMKYYDTYLKLKGKFTGDG